MTLGTSTGCTTGWALYQYSAPNNTLSIAPGGIHCSSNYVPFNYTGFEDPADQAAAEAYVAAGCSVYFVSCCSSQTTGTALLLHPSSFSPDSDVSDAEPPPEWRDRIWRLEQTVRQLSQALVNQSLFAPGKNPKKKVPKGDFANLRKRLCEGPKPKKK